ncbi:bifunctional ADP-dependent NAD(P)H-hydrate dehydratase/NAD(P)H-hydrate epimerase [Citricoccus sp. NR2]|uniref:bifunctional ADP-dependent NAD(P)H-hydrate dehydratase/NAD(P)H-hydrate epimerase n=1 Tax=Citricoccus sp. NR2 TaxID=3004095 RepID=UPI0022DE0FF9|nr:bifunctional ADP-dependent NAD(P)H-hydrate dehydratase/NAD(P)H-hydrate epimerase [Citricoccus sp. NR2]WBL17780.1 NAD(P)H-hydrate dehydratase [Citricoccus sp. NR2]
MRWAYTAEQIRAAEQPLLAAGEPLMRRAAYGLAQHILRLLRARHSRVSGATVAALVGKGNNGGDALWALAFLRRRGVHAVAIPVGADHGADITAADLHAEGRDALLQAGGSMATHVPEDTAVVVDAIFGTGFRGSADVPTMLRDAGVTVPEHAVVVACDVPSGLNASTGEIPGVVLPADLTVTFGGLKTGLLLGEGPRVAGRVELIDVGLEPLLGETPTDQMVGVFEKDTSAPVGAVFAPPVWDAHKYSRGVIAISAGSPQYPGAAVLTVAAAVATGVGMVRWVGVTGDDGDDDSDMVSAGVVAAHPEVVAGHEADGRADAWVLGPGWGTGENVHARYRQVLDLAGQRGTPVVLDASALELINHDDVARFAEIRRAGGAVVLTPHAGELGRLEERLLTEPGADDSHGRVDAVELWRARRMAAHVGAHVLLKGPTTVIAAPDGQARLDTTGGPELATAGSGDTLAGLVGSALGRTLTKAGGGTLDTLDKIAAAVRLHALAGRRAQQHGPFGASALAPAVREVLAEVGE